MKDTTTRAPALSALTVFAGAALALGLSPSWAQTAGTPNGTAYPSAGTTAPSSQPSTSTPYPASSGAAQQPASDTMTPLPSEPTSAGYDSYSSRDSWVPYTHAGYVQLSGGDAALDAPCSVNCGDPSWSAKFTAGGMFNNWLGLELSYLQLGDADRNNGKVSVKGVDISLVGTLPVGTDFNVHGKVGSTYSWTKTTVGAGIVGAEGKKNGFGLSYGAGVGYDFNRNWSITLDWERHNAKFAGDNDKSYDLTLLGLKYRF